MAMLLSTFSRDRCWCGVAVCSSADAGDFSRLLAASPASPPSGSGTSAAAPDFLVCGALGCGVAVHVGCAAAPLSADGSWRCPACRLAALTPFEHIKQVLAPPLLLRRVESGARSSSIHFHMPYRASAVTDSIRLACMPAHDAGMAPSSRWPSPSTTSIRVITATERAVQGADPAGVASYHVQLPESPLGPLMTSRSQVPGRISGPILDLTPIVRGQGDATTCFFHVEQTAGADDAQVDMSFVPPIPRYPYPFLLTPVAMSSLAGVKTSDIVDLHLRDLAMKRTLHPLVALAMMRVRRELGQRGAAGAWHGARSASASGVVAAARRCALGFPGASTAPDDDVAAAGDEEIVSNRDPLSLKAITLPVRGDTCTHAQPFDAGTYLEANSGATAPWACPCCRARVLPANLVVDPLLAHIFAAAATGAAAGDIGTVARLRCESTGKVSPLVPSTSIIITPSASRLPLHDTLVALCDAKVENPWNAWVWLRVASSGESPPIRRIALSATLPGSWRVLPDVASTSSPTVTVGGGAADDEFAPIPSRTPGVPFQKVHPSTASSRHAAATSADVVYVDSDTDSDAGGGGPSQSAAAGTRATASPPAAAGTGATTSLSALPAINMPTHSITGSPASLAGITSRSACPMLPAALSEAAILHMTGSVPVLRDLRLRWVAAGSGGCQDVSGAPLIPLPSPATIYTALFGGMVKPFELAGQLLRTIYAGAHPHYFVAAVPSDDASPGAISIRPRAHWTDSLRMLSAAVGSDLIFYAMAITCMPRSAGLPPLAWLADVAGVSEVAQRSAVNQWLRSADADAHLALLRTAEVSMIVHASFCASLDAAARRRNGVSPATTCTARGCSQYRGLLSRIPLMQSDLAAFVGGTHIPLACAAAGYIRNRAGMREAEERPAAAAVAAPPSPPAREPRFERRFRFAAAGDGAAAEPLRVAGVKRRRGDMAAEEESHGYDEHAAVARPSAGGSGAGMSRRSSSRGRAGTSSGSGSGSRDDAAAASADDGSAHHSWRYAPPAQRRRADLPYSQTGPPYVVPGSLRPAWASPLTAAHAAAAPPTAASSSSYTSATAAGDPYTTPRESRRRASIGSGR